MAHWCLSWNWHKVYRVLGVFPVFFTLGLLGWSIEVFFATVLPAIRDRGPVHAWLWGPVLTGLWLLSVWSYGVCVMRDPGHTLVRRPTVSSHGGTDRTPYIRVRGSEVSPSPRRRRADSVGSNSSDDSDFGGRLTGEQLRQAELIQCITATDGGQPRYCQKCNAAKPDRAHHCSSCGVCVLRFDHHCPWLNSCVGHHTQKPFLLFLGYTSVYTTALGGLTLWYYMYRMVLEKMGDISIECLFMMCLTLAFAAALWGFTAFHCYLTLNNLTTFESYVSNKYRVPGAAKGVQPGDVNLFDLGWRRNLRQVFGPSRRLWFFPVSTSAGDGLRYPINIDAYNELQRTVD
ncbi:palmitoyltransferase for Vac8p [Coemansia biformis]|uniref:Palmitoyltransferase n=1 Tax=Coemansia biformis TaxID=1286918 RepID=A0A9W7YDV4_9FUNG|nr:palmitoyltransferase for Vac8p [Coemansia biformis]